MRGLTVPDLEPREPIEVWLILDEDGVAVRVYSHGGRVADAYRARAVSIEGAQTEVTARYAERGYRAGGGWRPQRWTADRTGYGEIIHESSRTFR
jgi:hypothetical protein